MSRPLFCLAGRLWVAWQGRRGGRGGGEEGSGKGRAGDKIIG